jgi:hypothetical protein
VWETTDPDGCRIVLTPARWAHIVERHAELAGSRDAILAAVRFPAAYRSGHEPNEEWYYARGVGPARWVRVVVHYHADVGLITTAFPRGDLP